jgi:putative ATP-binding cassette transporter
LSWFVDNYSSLATWRATTDRLTSFDSALGANHSQSAAVQIPPFDSVLGSTLDAEHLSVSLPNGIALLAHAALHAQSGDRVLLQGPSGAGKSTLFRTLAGIWPFSSGTVHLPTDAMFIPQRPYFPNGALRDALAYPERPERYTDTQLTQALERALLPALANDLDRSDAWGQKLSGGEQQRLALARVFLKQPQWVFADEATSALDTVTEATLYQRLVEMVATRGGALVSIAHRPGVASFHTKTWVLTEQAADGDARFTVEEKRL